MPLGNVNDTFGMAAEYMSSALPWVTASVFTTTPVRFDFAKVSRFIIIRNYGPGELAMGFTRNGVSGSNRYVVMPGEQLETEMRVKELHIMALATTTSASIMAGLTTVDARYMPVLTGTIPNNSGGWDGVG